MTYDDARQFLFDLPRFALSGIDAYKPGLERMATLMDAMDHPETAFPGILVAGTNGKGSVASILSAISFTDGRRTGLHTSPHLQYLGERMRIDGVPADPGWIADRVSRFADTFTVHGVSFFEATTALSFLYFAENEVDLAIVEVGLGGRLDATNVLHADLSVITGIDYDHTAILGSTLEEIAREKAGIIKPARPVLTGASDPGVLSEIRQVATRLRAPLHVLDEEVEIEATGDTFRINTPVTNYTSLHLDLNGAFQRRNAALAVRAAELCPVLKGVSTFDVREGLKDVRGRAGLRARLEEISEDPLIIVDVAHNAQSLEAALSFCTDRYGGIDAVHIGLMDDKDADSIGSLLARYHVTVRILRLPTDRGADPDILAERFRSAGVDVAEVGLEIVEAMRATFMRRDSTLVTGSHVVAAEVLSLSAEPD